MGMGSGDAGAVSDTRPACLERGDHSGIDFFILYRRIVGARRIIQTVQPEALCIREKLLTFFIDQSGMVIWRLKQVNADPLGDRRGKCGAVRVGRRHVELGRWLTGFPVDSLAALPEIFDVEAGNEGGERTRLSPDGGCHEC